MILFVGQVARNMREREAFQEIDYRRMFGQVAKWVAEIDTPDRIAEFVSRAFHVACSGRPGPVVLALPEDMLTELCGPAVTLPPVKTPQADIVPDDWQSLLELLAEAERPMIVVGGGPWNRDAKVALRHFPATGTYRLRLRSGARISSTTSIQIMPAMWASASIQSWLND